MPIDKVFGVCAVACHLTAFGLYIWQMRRGNVNPNIVSWAIWTALTYINLTSYSAMTHDWVKAMVVGANALGCSVTLYCVIKHVRTLKKRGVRPPLDAPEKICAFSGAVSIIAWCLWHNAAVANLIVQGGVLAGFFPTARSLVKTQRGEHPAPWAAWTAGHIFMLSVVVMRWRGQWTDLAYPSIGLLSHAAILVLSSIYWRRRQSPRPA
jgi:hypothetical protein